MPIQISNDIKVGTMVISAENSMEGYLLCNGSLISRTVYSDLFSAISTTFGTGNGSTTFAIPDLVGAVPRGAGTSSGYPAESNVTVTLGAKQNDAVQPLTGNMGGYSNTLGYSTTSGSLYTTWQGGLSQLGNSGYNMQTLGIDNSLQQRTANENRMKNLGVNFFIKF